MNEYLKSQITKLDVMEWHKPVTEQILINIESQLDTTIPEQYREILFISDGVYCDYFRFIGTNEMLDMKEIVNDTPDYFIIGEDGGGLLAMIKLNSLDQSVYCTFGSFIDEGDFEKMGDNIRSWIDDRSPFCKGYYD